MKTKSLVEKAPRNSMSKLKIAILAGGWSGEREISLKSGETVFRALDRTKYEVKRYDPRDDLISLISERKGIDLAFVLLHRYRELHRSDPPQMRQYLRKLSTPSKADSSGAQTQA